MITSVVFTGELNRFGFLTDLHFHATEFVLFELFDFEYGQCIFPIAF